MTADRIWIEGELYLALEVVAEVYQVQSVWLQEVVAEGLIASARSTEVGLAIAALELDRVATVVRLHRVLGLDLETIALRVDSPSE